MTDATMTGAAMTGPATTGADDPDASAAAGPGPGPDAAEAADAADETLLLSRDGPVATLTINRPGRLNALTYAMFLRVPRLLAEAAAMDGIRSLVLRGAGRKSFSAGADIAEFGAARTTAEQAAAYDQAVLAAEDALAAFPHPVIAAVHGYCYGGGCALALACDIRFASPAARFAITPAKLGLVYPLRATKRLVDAVGPSQAHAHVRCGLRRPPGAGLRPGRRGARRPRRRRPRVHHAARDPIRSHPARGQGDRRPHPGWRHPR
jgi:hypothetical protein